VCLLAENGDNIQVQPLATRPDHDTMQLSLPVDARQLTAVAGHSGMNDVSVENVASHVVVNGNHVMSPDASDTIRSPTCVIQSVYSLPIQQSVACDGWKNSSVTLPL